jgi:hypothetical protein
LTGKTSTRDQPLELLATYDRIGHDVDYIRVLMSGELTEAWAVLQTQTRLGKENDRIAGESGAELLSSTIARAAMRRGSGVK